MEDIQLTTWKLHINNEIEDIYQKIDSSEKNISKQIDISNKNSIEEYLFQIGNFHLSRIGNTELNPLFEYSIIKSSTNEFHIEYEKKTKKYPFLTIFIYLPSDENFCMIFTNVNLERYKYKEIPNENQFMISVPRPYYHVVLEQNTLYGCGSFDEKSSNGTYIKLNIWKSILELETKKDISIEPWNEIKPIEEKEQKKYILHCKNILNEILYDSSSWQNIKLSKTWKSHLQNESSTRILIENKHQLYKDYEDICEMYGEDITKDVYPFFDEDLEIFPENRFYNHKIVQKWLPLDICYWILHESEKLNDWQTSPYPNYDYYINIEKLPSIFNYILFISTFWLDHIMNIYNIKNSRLHLNIKDIFISKFTCKEKEYLKKQKDDKFLIITVFLNDSRNYIGGELEFENVENKIKLNQGDMLVHHGKQFRNKGTVTEGIKYTLTFFIQIQ